MESQQRMVVKLHALTDHAPEVRPARAKRKWMDDFPDRHAYRCLPLSIANAFGWEVLCPAAIEVRWNGGMGMEDVEVVALEDLPGGIPVEHFCRSNFTRGIVTFHLDYLIQTEPGWGILATGPFNDPKDGAAPLTGVIETDWLPYPFTMNWQLTKAGVVRFEKGEPFCFFVPVPRLAIPESEVQIHRLADDPELEARQNQFRQSREGFLERMRAGDRDAIREAWQRHYFIGRHPDGTLGSDHLNKLRLKEPVDMRSAPQRQRKPDPTRTRIEVRRAKPSEPG